MPNAPTPLEGGKDKKNKKNNTEQQTSKQSTDVKEKN